MWVFAYLSVNLFVRLYVTHLCLWRISRMFGSIKDLFT